MPTKALSITAACQNVTPVNNTWLKKHDKK